MPFYFTQHLPLVIPHRYWNEEYLVVLQHNPQHEFNNIFVWGWNQCKNPTFLFRSTLILIAMIAMTSMMAMMPWKQ